MKERFVALLCTQESKRVRAIDASDMGDARQEIYRRANYARRDWRAWFWIGDLHVMSVEEAKRLVKDLKRCISKRTPDAKREGRKVGC